MKSGVVWPERWRSILVVATIESCCEKFNEGEDMGARAGAIGGFLRGWICIAGAMLLALAGPATGRTITTVAGGGVGDGGPATSASLYEPNRVAVDAAGNFYIAEPATHRIRKVDGVTGVISTVAGNGTSGFSGDGGVATAATLWSPQDVAVDASGNIYIADSYNGRVRKVDGVTGVITTVAGGGPIGYLGDGGAATSAHIMNIAGIAVDAGGSIYIAELSNSRIRKVDGITGVISTVAGNGTSGFSGDGGAATSASISSPMGIAVDAGGSFYFAEQNNNRVRKVDGTTGVISTVAGNGSAGFSGDGGAATSASLNFALGVGVDTVGNIYIADSNNHRIRKVDISSGLISTVAGNGSGPFLGDGGAATDARLISPAGIAVDASGNLYIAELNNHRIRKVDGTTGVINTAAGSGTAGPGDGGPSTSANLYYPRGAAIDAAGNLYVADTESHRVRKVDGATGVISTMAGNGSIGFSGEGGAATAASLWSPNDVAVDAMGNIYIADSSNNRIRKVDGTTGLITTVAGNGVFGFSGDGGAATSASLRLPVGVAVDAGGNIYIADRLNYRIRKVDGTTGVISTVAGNGTSGFSGDGGVATSASISSPMGVAVDTGGNIYFADWNNNRVRKVDGVTGLISTVAGNGLSGFLGDGGAATATSLFSPQDVTVDGLGNLYIADTQNDRVRMVNGTTGMIRTVAGRGAPGFSGDGGAATGASLYRPSGVALDAAGNLYIGDNLNHRIRKVTKAAAPVRGDSNWEGKADLFWRENAPGLGLSWWTMSGNAATGTNYHQLDSDWQVADVGDLDGDGKADIVWRRASDGANYLWTLDGLGFKGFFDLGILSPAQWSLTGIADLDGDGKGDVVWRGTDGTVYGWLMNGGTIASQGVIGNPGTQWVIADLADMDGDGKADIVFRNTTDGGIYVFFMNGLAVATGGFVGTVDPAAWTLVGAADFSGDGKADLLWRHTSGDTWVWLMNGATFGSAGGIGNPGAGWSVRSFGDFDGDGKSDLLWRHSDGTTYLWTMNGAAVTSYLPVSNPGGTWQVVAP